ncbi:SDR family oxidoreductase [Winogradskya consettensis]|uniref:Dehydrogenase n=1 Tax=Winogradskya consettensis TaxID=113560 RepID=A0A919SMF8_9ACTN|nr:SDR family oxidoreductase [Actinoplanes consettensis]GIM74836.1 dehydrogenase [Actinoplanes consettensis]
MTPVDYRNQTTLITGASAGIGREFARALARRGSGLALVARRRGRLDTLAAELEVPTTVIPFDLSEPAAGERLAAEIAGRGLSVTSVINNAGFGSYGNFHELDPGRLRDEIAVNVAAVADITRAFLPTLRAAGTGVLVNIASLGSYQAGPHMAQYAATKAFVLSLTEAVWQESIGTGLRVLSLAPGLTRTEFFDVVGNDSMTRFGRFQTPEQVVAYGLSVLDRRNPPPSVISGLPNRITANAGRLLTRRRIVLIGGVAGG